MHILRLGGRRGIRRFAASLSRIHDLRRHPLWAPTPPFLERHTLSPGHPFWRHGERALFMAFRNGRPVGRIAAIENRKHNEVHGDRLGFFGFFAVSDDAGATGHDDPTPDLLDAARAWLEERGLEGMRGPVSPSMNHECGCLVEGFDRPNRFLTPWNPPHYPERLEAAGLRSAHDLVGVWAPTDHVFPERVERAVQVARRRGNIVFRDGREGDFDDRAETLRLLYNEAWAESWGFVPLGAEEFADFAAAGRHLFLERFNVFADDGKETVAFLLVAPDFNEVLRGARWKRWAPVALARTLRARRRLKVGRIMLLGLRESHRGSRLLPLLMHELLRRGREYGAEGAEGSWLLEGGLMHRAAVGIGLEVTKRWRIYE